MPSSNGLGIFGSLLTTGTRYESIRSLLTESHGNLTSGRYGLLAIGNGQAPGTGMGLGIAGTGATLTGFEVLRRRTAGLAVFFFAAFLIAGFLAGFFLPGFFSTFLASFFTTRLALDLRDAGFLAAGFFLRAGALRTAFFFAVFFAAVLVFAMTPSNQMYDSGR